MPIIIDQNAPAVLPKTYAVQKNVDPKYFSQNLTGNGKRASGLFSTSADTFDNFLKEKRYHTGAGLDHLYDSLYRGFIDQNMSSKYYKGTKRKDYDYKLFERVSTCAVPPMIFDVLDDYALSFPKNTGLFNLNALETIWTPLQTGTIDGHPVTTYLKLEVQAMDLYSRERNIGGQNEVHVAGQPLVYVLLATVRDDMDPNGDMIFTKHQSKIVDETQGVIFVAYLPEDTAMSFAYNDFSTTCMIQHYDTIDNDVINLARPTTFMLQTTIGDQSMSDCLKSQANTLSHQGREIVKTTGEVLAKRFGQILRKDITTKYPDAYTDIRNVLSAFVQNIDILNEMEDDLIDTDTMAEIFQSIKENLNDQQLLNIITKHSLRLLLSQRLHEIDEMKKGGALYEFKAPNAAVEAAMKANKSYSIQQKKIIMSKEPLIIGQAGAGAGKSHTVVGRLNYMKDQGEDLSQVLILSFTNVAAININNRFPDVRSETLANMFHTIYSKTFPTQNLSQPSTVANSLKLLNPASQYFASLGYSQDEVIGFIDAFAMRLEQFDQTGFKRVNLQQELKYMASLLEDNMKIAIDVLNAVEQTTLELQPIIIHHMLMNNAALNIPDQYKNIKFIITDESQDISTFEYILLLELTLHHQSQLLIIGDGSQTLYEFRNSDPRYLNALESSGVFTSHKLDINYRSNQEILTFANQFLEVIDANKFAKIQLTSSSFVQPTEKSFTEKVIVADNPITGGGAKEYSESLREFIATDVEFQTWFLEKVRNDEQVAIMGWTRKEVLDVQAEIEELLKKHKLNVPCTNIMSESDRPMTLLSRFARVKAELLRSLDPTNKHYVAEIERHTSEFVSKFFNRSTPKQKYFYEDYIMKTVKEIVQTNAWFAVVKDFRNGNFNAYQVGSYLIQQMLRAETKKNAMEQYLKKKKEVPDYDSAKIILSTIHGTKGLEFEHTVVMYNESKKGATSQESLRMMFVALSRAKKSEFIINSHLAGPAYGKSRTTNNSLSAMFQTPMNTAYMRAKADIINQSGGQPTP